MDIWVVLAFTVFVVSVLIGVIACWKSTLPVSQKLLWTGIIVVFPIAGAAIYFIASDDARQLLT